MATLLITKETGDYWSFVVDGNTAETISNTRNDLLTIGNQCHFKTSNGANLIQKQEIFPADITVVASGTFTFTTKEQLFNKLIEKGFFDWINGTGGGGGVDRFDDLTDTFKYIGKDGYAVVVDETELRLIAVPFYNVQNSTDLGDMPHSIVGGKMLVSKTDESGYEFADIPGAPDTLLRTVGYFVYEDAPSVPTTLPATVSTKITNNGIGSETDYSKAPYGVSRVWNTVDDQIDLSDLSVGDTLDMTLKLDFTIPSGTGGFFIEMKLAIGSLYERTRIIHSGYVTAGTYSEEFYYGFAVKNEDEINYPSELYIRTVNAGSLTGNEMYFRVIKNNLNTTTIVDDSHFKGKWPTELALNSAIPSANDGDYAIVDLSGTTALEYIWNSADSVWAINGGGGAITKTSDLVNDGSDGVNPFGGIVSIKDYPRLLVATQNFTISTGKTAKWAVVNGAIWYPLTANNASEPNTFTQSGTTIIFKTIRPINNYIAIFEQ